MKNNNKDQFQEDLTKLKEGAVGVSKELGARGLEVGKKGAKIAGKWLKEASKVAKEKASDLKQKSNDQKTGIINAEFEEVE
jgi:hypothetical protein